MGTTGVLLKNGLRAVAVGHPLHPRWFVKGESKMGCYSEKRSRLLSYSCLLNIKSALVTLFLCRSRRT